MIWYSFVSFLLALPNPNPGTPFQQSEQVSAIAPITYRIELLDADLPQVRIHLAFPLAEKAAETLVGLGGSGDLEGRGQDLTLDGARSSTGKALPWQKVGAAQWSISSADAQELEISFLLGQTPHRQSGQAPTYYLPILEKELLHLIGSNVLPAPMAFDGGVERSVTLEWIGFEERGWRTTSSFAPSGKAASRIIALDSFRHGLFLAGDFLIEERVVGGELLHLAIWGDDWGSSVGEFIDLCALIVEMERSFFEDYAHPRYLISLIPVGAKNPNLRSMGGTGLTDSFALFLPPGSPLNEGPGSGMSISWLLAHEMFHEWNGLTIQLSQPERRGYWFSEGFTDFYTRRLLHQNDLLTDQEYIDSWNRRFGEYHSNPERLAPATAIEEGFWKNADVGFLPYQRGDLVALLVDRAIARTTKGARNLDDLMKELVAQSKNHGPYSVDELLAAITAATDQATGDLVRAIVVDGAEISLPADFDLSGHEVVSGSEGYVIQPVR